MPRAAAPILRRKPAAPPPVLQAKLAVGPAVDRFEQEADRAAARVGSAAPAVAAAPPPTVSALGAQRVALPPRPGPERKDESPAPPEHRARRKARTGPAKEPEKRGVAQKKTAAVPRKDTENKAQRKAMAPPARESEKRSPAGKPAVASRSAERKVQRDAVGDSNIGTEGGQASPATESAIVRMKSGTAPGLDPDTRETVERAVGADLGDVRVHAGNAASAAARDLGARAFTVGSDMFFGQGEFRPATTEGKRLIAHEATHTVQQRGGSASRKIQRAVTDEKVTAKKITRLEGGSKGREWSIDIAKPPAGEGKGVMTVPKLALPMSVDGKLKGEANPAIGHADRVGLPVSGQAYTRQPQAPRKERNLGSPAQKWTGEVGAIEAARTSSDPVDRDWAAKMGKEAGPLLKAGLKTQIENQKNVGQITKGGDPVYALTRKSAQAANQFILIGTVDELAGHDSLLRPMVARKSGDYRSYDIDHILEDQLNGPNTLENMWMLESSYNRSCGNSIRQGINDSITDTLASAEKAHEKKKKEGEELSGPLPAGIQDVKQNYQLTFSKIVKGDTAAPADYWTRSEIRTGEHLKYFRPLTEPELVTRGLLIKEGASPTRINVFTSPNGGRVFAFPATKDGKKLRRPDDFFRGITITGEPIYKPIAAGAEGQIIIEIPIEYRKAKEKGSEEIVKAAGNAKVQHHPRLGFGGFVTRDSIKEMFTDADFTPASPISIREAGIDDNGDLFATGEIVTAKMLFPGLHMPIRFRGSDIFMSLPIPTDALRFGPVQVTDAAVDIGVGAKGFFIAGTANVMVKDVVHGTVTARGENDGVTVAGKLDLDLDFLKGSTFEVSYKLGRDELKGKFTYPVAKDKLPGVESGQITITASRDSFGVTGMLKLGGVLSGSTLTVGYTPETGLVMEARDLPLPVAKLPGVTDAKVSVRVTRHPETGDWSASGGGKATLAAPGASGTFDVMFDGGAIDFSGRVDVAKGPASGWIQISGTNRALDEEGKPIEGKPLGDLAIWGKGEASVTFGSILKGTAGIEYTRDGHLIVVGRIAMPPTYDLFPKKDLSPEKPIFKFKTPDFPIWGVEIGPVGVGVFGFADASLVAEAWVGPGQLRDAAVEGKIDLDKPEEATVDGEAKFHLPAYAGLTLDVGGGLKAKAGIAYGRGRVGIYGSLGLLVENSIKLEVHWSAAKGLSIGATPQITASPKFEIGVSASLALGIDFGLFDIEKEWGPWKKKLGEFGPDTKLGATFPMAWSEVNGLDIDPSKIEIQKPDIDAPAIVKDAFLSLV